MLFFHSPNPTTSSASPEVCRDYNLSAPAEARSKPQETQLLPACPGCLWQFTVACWLLPCLAKQSCTGSNVDKKIVLLVSASLSSDLGTPHLG